MRAPSLRVAIPLLAFAVALSLFGCGKESTGPAGGGDTTTALDRAEGGIIAREIEASVTAMSPTGASRYGGESADRALGLVFASRVAPLASVGWNYQGCGVTSPASAPDSDSDGIPDNVSIGFSLPACALTGVRGKDEGDVMGEMTIADQSAEVDNLAFKVTLSELTYAFTNATKTFSETRTGTRVVTGDTLTISQANNVTTVFDSASTNQTLTSAIGLAYTATAAGRINFLSGLSTGSVTVNNTGSYTDGTNSDNFTIATVTPLVYNPSCAATGTQPFQNGEVTATVTASGRTGVLHIVWAACGIAKITRSTS